MNQLTKMRVDDMLAIKNECVKNGIDYDTFIAGCRVVYKERKLSTELLQKAKRALKNIVYYGTERAKLQGKTIQELVSAESDFLAHGFQYCTSQEDGVNAAISKYASYCNIHYNMFDPDDMQDLAKKVAKKMQVTVKDSDPGYLDAVMRALPAYEKGEFPAPKHSPAVDKFLSEVKKLVEEKPNLAKANAQCLPDARQYYLEDDESFALEFFARQQETPAIDGTGNGLILVRQLGHYLICDDKGLVLHDSLDPHTFSSLQYGDTSAWIAERKELIKLPEHIDGVGSNNDEEIPEGIYVVRNNNQKIILATPNPNEANSFQCLYGAGGVNNEYIHQHLKEDYGLTNSDYDVAVDAILAEASTKYNMSKFVEDKSWALFAVTPLLAAGIEKF